MIVLPKWNDESDIRRFMDELEASFRKLNPLGIHVSVTLPDYTVQDLVKGEIPGAGSVNIGANYE